MNSRTSCRAKSCFSGTSDLDFLVFFLEGFSRVCDKLGGEGEIAFGRRTLLVSCGKRVGEARLLSIECGIFSPGP